MDINLNTYNHSIYFDSNLCRGDMNCLKVCPVEAIRIRNGKALMLENKCIDCGECVKVCETGAIKPLTNSFKDFSKYKYIVAVPTFVLYGLFERKIMPKTILTSLKKIGFDDVVDITRACLSIYKAMDKYIKNYKGKKPLLSSFCPTVIRLIQMRYPALLNNIIPVIPPMELAAREIKNDLVKRMGFSKEEIAVIYITPCPAKMILISQKIGKFYSNFDGAIPVSEIYNPLLLAIHQSVKTGVEHADHFDVSGMGLNFSRTGGLSSMIEGENHITVSGINDILNALEEIERDKLQDIDFIELHACNEGCIGGSMVVENVYNIRTKLSQLVEYYGEKRISISKRDVYENSEMFYDSIYEPLPQKPIDNDIKKAIEKISKRKEFYATLPGINCGACGSPTCFAFAEDFIRGDVKREDCVIIQNLELKKKLNKNSDFTDNNLSLIK